MSGKKENKFMHIRLLTIIFSILVIQEGFSQNKFHRTYPTVNGKNLVCISASQMSDGNYVAFEAQLETDTNNKVYADTLILTSYKPKGDINWSRYIVVDSSFSGIIPSLGSIVQGDNDSIYFSFVSEATDKPNKIIGAVSSGGGDGWMKSYTAANKISDGVAISHLLANYNKSLFSAYTGGKDKESNVSLSRKDYEGNNIWSKTYFATDATGRNIAEYLYHLSLEKDTSLIFAGQVDSLNRSAFLAVSDTLGLLKWSRKYTSGDAVLFPSDALKLADSTYLVAGTLLYNDDLRHGFIIKTDKTGRISWGKRITFGPTDTTLVKHIALENNNTILVAGVNFVAGTKESYPFVFQMQAEGNVVWKKKFPRVSATDDITGALFTTKDRGAAYITTVLEENKARPSFMKLNDEGSTSCETNIDENILFDKIFLADTLRWQIRNEGLSDTLKYKSGPYSYDVPLATLEVRPFCPKEPIDWTFNIPIKGATMYEWSTGVKGEKLDSLRVFEEGEYSVTVTIGERVCYMLCDTSKLSRYKTPQAELLQSLGNFCVNDKQTLRASYIPGHPIVKSITWSTGDSMVGSIEIAQPGIYRVTIVDQCDEIATAEIAVGPFPRKISQASITGQVTVDCLQGTATGILTAAGNSNGLGVERYLWSNGQNTASISINNTEVRTYTVTVLDGCGNTATANYTIEFKGAGITSASIVPNSARLCSEKVIELNAVTEKAGKYTYAWSQGGTGPKIDIKDPGTYTVTITDVCGNKITASRDVAASSFVITKLISDLRLNVYKRDDCTGMDVGILFSPDNDINLLKAFKWSSGETTRGINFTGKKTYAITVTDICDTEYSVSGELDFPDISYPKVFFPDGLNATFDVSNPADSLAKEIHLLNRTYGPINKDEYCLDQITDYTFYVYNRWGQQVFESRDWKKEWDGRFKDEKAPSETYVWVVKYTIFGFEKKQKGDLTMIRL